MRRTIIVSVPIHSFVEGIRLGLLEFGACAKIVEKDRIYDLTQPGLLIVAGNTRRCLGVQPDLSVAVRRGEYIQLVKRRTPNEVDSLTKSEWEDFAGRNQMVGRDTTRVLYDVRHSPTAAIISYLYSMKYLDRGKVDRLVID